MNYPTGQFTYGRPSTVGVYKSWPWWRLQCIRSLHATCFVITILAPVISRWRLDFFFTNLCTRALQCCQAKITYASGSLVRVTAVFQTPFIDDKQNFTLVTRTQTHADHREKCQIFSPGFSHKLTA